MPETTYLKLGGSLITDKKTPHTARLDIIERAASEIRSALNAGFSGRLILGHGSGSFGHVPASRYQTRCGVHTAQQWSGFSRVWNEARTLNQLIVDACIRADLPIMVFPPSALFITDHRQVLAWNDLPLLEAVKQGIIPLVFGDVVFDRSLGGTILSTEEVFLELCHHIPPARILLAGMEKGVWQDYPKCNTLISRIRVQGSPDLARIAGGSDAPDVTGGMLEKIRILQTIIEQFPACQGQIFSGVEPGSIEKALLGSHLGTVVSSDS